MQSGDTQHSLSSAQALVPLIVCVQHGLVELGNGGSEMVVERGGPAQELNTVQLVAHPEGHLVGQGAYTVSVAVLVQHSSVIHGCVIVDSRRHAGRMQVAVSKVHDDHGAGVSTRVLKDGQWRGARVMVVTSVQMTV